MIRSIEAVLVGAFFPLALACAADGHPGIPQLESSTVGWSKVAYPPITSIPGRF
jgi:hypothetical protein